MQIERGIDQKYLKPPIGEDEETKRERIREMIEAANAENIPKSLKPKRDSYLMKKGKSGKGDLNGNENENHNDDDEKSSEVSSTSEEALRKELTCLERWETSLSAATNFSQIFIHLNTLDRSIMWDKSVLNARCRICRKKGIFISFILNVSKTFLSFLFLICTAQSLQMKPYCFSSMSWLQEMLRKCFYAMDAIEAFTCIA